MTFRRRSTSLLAVVLTVLTACSSTDTGEEPAVKIAFFQDLSVPASLDLVSPSFLAFETVMQGRLADTEGIAVELVQLDMGGDAVAAVEITREVAADSGFVLAVLAPFWQEPPEVARILAEAGVPTISLSPESASPWGSVTSPPGDPSELWRRFVPGGDTEAVLLAGIVARGQPGDATQPVCLVTEGSDHGAALVAGIADRLSSRSPTIIDGADAIAAAGEVASSGCDVVVWGGFPPGARAFADAMAENGSASGSPIDLAGGAMKTIMPPLHAGGDAAVVSSVACACADVSLELDLESRRFVNAYQSEHGLTPGAYAVEAWDAGHIVSDAFTSGDTTREEMRATFRALTAYEGIARTYEFDEAGELIGAHGGLFMAAGTRWLPVPD